MIFQAEYLLLDIEGTTSSISYVHDTMFPFVRENLNSYLSEHWGTSSLQESIQLIASDAGMDRWPDTDLSDEKQMQQFADEVIKQMDEDRKATGLKDLQGKIWKSGFEAGDLKAHVYEDTLPAIDAWRDAGKDVRIYSSGSVQAQLLFFGHTVEGNLLDRFSAHYDTQIGGKKEAASYETIAKEIGCPPKDILFVSDVLAELEAARDAGCQTALSLRPGNAPIEEEHSHPEFTRLTDIKF